MNKEQGMIIDEKNEFDVYQCRWNDIKKLELLNFIKGFTLKQCLTETKLTKGVSDYYVWIKDRGH